MMRSRTSTVGLVLAFAISGCGFLLAPSPSCLNLDLDLAMVSARLFSMDGEPQGTIFQNQTEKLYDKGVIPEGVWRIQVDAIGVFPQQNPPGGVTRVPLHWIIDIDKCTGQRSIFAQG